MRKDTPKFLQDFVKKYAENRCRFMMTCDHMGISYPAAREYRLTRPDFDDALSKEERLLSERVEGGLVDEALTPDGNIVAKIFYLKNNWKEKYGERQVVEVQPGQLWFEQKPSLEGEVVTPQLDGDVAD